MPLSSPAACCGAPGPGPPSRYTSSLDGNWFRFTSLPSDSVVKMAPLGAMARTMAGSSIPAATKASGRPIRVRSDVLGNTEIEALIFVSSSSSELAASGPLDVQPLLVGELAAPIPNGHDRAWRLH